MDDKKISSLKLENKFLNFVIDRLLKIIGNAGKDIGDRVCREKILLDIRNGLLSLADEC